MNIRRNLFSVPFQTNRDKIDFISFAKRFPRTSVQDLIDKILAWRSTCLTRKQLA